MRRRTRSLARGPTPPSCALAGKFYAEVEGKSSNSECPFRVRAVVRRRFSSGCKSHPAIAPAGSNRSSHGGDEMAEAFG